MSEVLNLRISKLYEQLGQLGLPNEQTDSLRSLFDVCFQGSPAGRDREVSLPHRFWSNAVDAGKQWEDSLYLKFIGRWMPQGSSELGRQNSELRLILHNLRVLMQERWATEGFFYFSENASGRWPGDPCSVFGSALYCTGLSICLGQHRDLFDRVWTLLSVFRLPIEWEGKIDHGGKPVINSGRFVCWPLDPERQRSVYG